MRRNTFNIECCGIKIRVFKIGTSAQLSSNISQKLEHDVGVAHTHFTFEVFFVTEGTLKLISENGTADYESAALIVPPRIGHYSVPDRDGSYCLLFSFEKGESEFEKRLSSQITVATLTDEAIFYIKKASEMLDIGTVSAEKDAELLITLLFNELFRALIPDVQHSESTQSSQKHISAIETYINENIKQSITLKNISAKVYLSERQVSRIISKEYGVSLPKLVNDKRLAAAEILLRTSDISVARISQEVGIVSESYFYTLFKEKYGISPLQYRKRLS